MSGPKSKGFTAPVLQKQEHAETLEDQDKKRKYKKLKENTNIGDNCSVQNQECTNKKEENKKQTDQEKKGKIAKKIHSKDLNTEDCEKAKETIKKFKKPEVSLTDSQYDDIFEAVLKNEKSNPNSQQDILQVEMAKEIDSENIQFPTKETSVSKSALPDVLGTPTKKPKASESETPKSHKSLSQSSAWGSHLRKNPSQVSSLLKEYQESQKSLAVSSLLSPETTASSSDDEGVPMSQQSHHSQRSLHKSMSPHDPNMTKDQRKRLEQLQALRNVGVWVYCCRPSCQKQRYLASVTDPQDVPEIWYCHMNPDTKYNHCQAEEQKLSEEEEEDMIYNEFTAGSIVWARVAGYPWWPAMVDDDPDLEQYYWLDDDFKTVTYYHVVFFDEVAVTRAWVNLKNIKSYIRNENSFKSVTCRGLDYKRRIRVAKEQANDAATLNTAMRLKIYSFIARYNGPITTSASKKKQTISKYKLKVHLKKKPNQKEKKQIENQVTKKSNAPVKHSNMNIDHSIQKQENEQKSMKRDLEKEAETEDYTLPKKKKKSKFEKQVDKLMKKRKPRSKESNKSEVKSIDLTSNKNNEECAKPKGKNVKKKDTSNIADSSKPTEESFVKSNENMKSTCLSLDYFPSENPIKESHKQTDETSRNENNSKDFQVASSSKSDQKSDVEQMATTEIGENPSNNPTVDKQIESETPSGIAEIFTKPLSDNSIKPTSIENTDNSIGSMIEPSQPQIVDRRESQEEMKNSQTTFVDFLDHMSEDAVVPEAHLSQLSEPFEE